MALCYLCREHSYKSRATHVLFHHVDGRLIATKSVWNGKSPTVCETCAKKKMRPKCHLYYGYLSETMSKQLYRMSCEGSYADKLRREGLVVIKLQELSCDSNGITPFMSDVDEIINKKKLNCADSKNLATLSDEIDNGKISRNPRRLWRCISGDTIELLGKEKEKAQLVKNINTFSLSLEKLLFPDIYYGRMAFNTAVAKLDRTKVNPPVSTMALNKINFLCRLVGLDTQQHFHRDSSDFHFSCIIVRECVRKYEFSYYVGSHELNYNEMGKCVSNEDYIKKCVSDSDLTRINIEKDSIIFFSSNLVHGGGASGVKPGIGGKERKEISEMAVQVEFVHTGIKGGILPSGRTIPYKFEGDECIYNGDSPNFKKKDTLATQTWLNNYQNTSNYTIRDSLNGRRK